MLIRQAHQRSKLFVTIAILDRVFKFLASVCNGCHDVSMVAIDINSIAILNVYISSYLYIIKNCIKKFYF